MILDESSLTLSRIFYQSVSTTEIINAFIIFITFQCTNKLYISGIINTIKYVPINIITFTLSHFRLIVETAITSEWRLAKI